MHEVYHMLGFCHDSGSHYDLMDYLAAGGHNVNPALFWHWFKLKIKNGNTVSR